MKQNVKWILQLSIIMIICLCLPSIIFAQGDPGADPDTTVPVDGGLSILAAAGVAYGVKKIKEYKNKKGADAEKVK